MGETLFLFSEKMRQYLQSNVWNTLVYNKFYALHRGKCLGPNSCEKTLQEKVL